MYCSPSRISDPRATKHTSALGALWLGQHLPGTLARTAAHTLLYCPSPCFLAAALKIYQPTALPMRGASRMVVFNNCSKSQTKPDQTESQPWNDQCEHDTTLLCPLLQHSTSEKWSLLLSRQYNIYFFFLQKKGNEHQAVVCKDLTVPRLASQKNIPNQFLIGFMHCNEV